MKATISPSTVATKEQENPRHHYLRNLRASSGTIALLVALGFVPLSLVLAWLRTVSPIWVFSTSALAIIPLAECIRRAADQMAKLAGPAIGGLLTVTLGNTAELVLAIFVLSAGAQDVVKGQITGSIIGNGLLALGLAILVGGWGRDRVRFHRARASLISSLLILALIGLSVPAIFDYTERGAASTAMIARYDERLSLGVSAVLILVYAATLFYILYTHRDVFEIKKRDESPDWSWTRSWTVLVGATVATACESYLLAQALESTAGNLGLTPTFIGVVVLAIIGNAADYLAGMYFARTRQMSLSISVTIGSTIQVALLMAPLLVFISFFMGHPMNLVFTSPLEIVAIAAVAFAVNSIARSGEATWFAGVMLLSVYAILGMAFFYVRP